MESELRAALGPGKLLGQQNSFLHAEYLIELVETFLRHGQILWDLSFS